MCSAVAKYKFDLCMMVVEVVDSIDKLLSEYIYTWLDSMQWRIIGIGLRKQVDYWWFLHELFIKQCQGESNMEMYLWTWNPANSSDKQMLSIIKWMQFSAYVCFLITAFVSKKCYQLHVTSKYILMHCMSI